MYMKESIPRKIGTAIFYTAFAAVSLALGIIHAEQSVNAGKINDDYTIPDVLQAYNNCTVPAYIPDPELSFEKLKE